MSTEHRYLDCRSCKTPICRRSPYEEDHIFLSTYFERAYWRDDFPASVDLEQEKGPLEINVPRLGRKHLQVRKELRTVPVL
jgi:hypothetical protein